MRRKISVTIKNRLLKNSIRIILLFEIFGRNKLICMRRILDRARSAKINSRTLDAHSDYNNLITHRILINKVFEKRIEFLNLRIANLMFESYP